VRLPFVTASLIALSLHAATKPVAAEAPKAAGPAPYAQNDDVKQLLSVVLAETEDFWGATFKAGGLTYEEPKLVLFTASSLPHAVLFQGHHTAHKTTKFISIRRSPSFGRSV